MSLRRNTLWNLLGSSLPLLAAILFIPYCLNQLGGESFGVLTLIWALIGYFSLFDLGVGRALTYEIGRRQSSEAGADIPAVVRSGLALTFLAGIMGALVMFYLAPYLAGSWLKITPNLAPDTQLAFEITAVGVIFTTLGSGLRGAQEGLNQFKIASLNKAILGFCTFLLPAFSIYIHGSDLSSIVVYLVAARIFMVISMLFQLRHYVFAKGLHPITNHIRSLYSFGIWITISGIVGPLMVYGDRFFVSAAIGATLLPLYAIPQEGLQRLLLIPGSFCAALLPKLAALPMGERMTLYRKSHRHVMLIMLVICLVSAAMAYPLLSAWLNPEFAKESLAIVCILAVGIWLNAIALVPYTFLHANGSTKITAIFHLVELVIYLAALYYLVDAYGLVGAALAWVLRVGVDLVLLEWAVRKVRLA
jgi:O-antigen/teichoic acid export membrane protein